MPKDRYTCASNVGGHRGGFRARRRLDALALAWRRCFVGRRAEGGNGPSRTRPSRTVAWPSSAPSSTREASGASPLSTATAHEEIWMRPRRPYITTLAGVTINRSGESAVIRYRDPAVRPVVFAIGQNIDRCSDAKILARFNDPLHAARAQTEGRQHVVVEIPRGHAQLEYFPRLASGCCGAQSFVASSMRAQRVSSSSTSTIMRSRSQRSVDSCVPTPAGACESSSPKTTTPSLRSSRHETSRTEKRLTIGGDSAGAVRAVPSFGSRIGTTVSVPYPCTRSSARSNSQH